MSEQTYIGIEPKHCNECGKDYTPVVCSDKCPHNKIGVAEWQAREQDELLLTPKDIVPYLKAKYPHMYKGNDDAWCRMRESALLLLLKSHDVELLLDAHLAKAKQHYEQEAEGWKQLCAEFSEELTRVYDEIEVIRILPDEQKRLDRPELREISNEIADALGCGECVCREDCLSNKPFKDCPHSSVLPKLVALVEPLIEESEARYELIRRLTNRCEQLVAELKLKGGD